MKLSKDKKQTLQIPAQYKQFFWDCDFQSLDTAQDKQYIIQRILEKGKIDSIKWLFSKYTKSEIYRQLKNPFNLSSKTIYFWKLFFNKYGTS